MDYSYRFVATYPKVKRPLYLVGSYLINKFIWEKKKEKQEK